MQANIPSVVLRERLILLEYYFLGYTHKQIGKRLGVTRERVRQLRLRGLHRIRVDAEVLDLLSTVHTRALDIRRRGGPRRVYV